MRVSQCCKTCRFVNFSTVINTREMLVTVLCALYGLKAAIIKISTENMKVDTVALLA